MKKVTRATETDLDEMPSLARIRLAAKAKRAQKAHAYDKKLISKLLEQLGVPRETVSTLRLP